MEFICCSGFFNVSIEQRRDIAVKLEEGISELGNRHDRAVVMCQRPLRQLMIYYTNSSALSNSEQSSFDIKKNPLDLISPSLSPESLEIKYSSPIVRPYLTSQRWVWSDSQNSAFYKLEKKHLPLSHLLFDMIYQHRVEEGFLPIYESPDNVTLYIEKNFARRAKGVEGDLNSEELEKDLVVAAQFIIFKNQQSMSFFTELFVDSLSVIFVADKVDDSSLEFEIRYCFDLIASDIKKRDQNLINRLFSFGWIFSDFGASSLPSQKQMTFDFESLLKHSDGFALIVFPIPIIVEDISFGYSPTTSNITKPVLAENPKLVLPRFLSDGVSAFLNASSSLERFAISVNSFFKEMLFPFSDGNFCVLELDCGKKQTDTYLDEVKEYVLDNLQQLGRRGMDILFQPANLSHCFIKFQNPTSFLLVVVPRLSALSTSERGQFNHLSVSLFSCSLPDSPNPSTSQPSIPFKPIFLSLPVAVSNFTLFDANSENYLHNSIIVSDVSKIEESDLTSFFYPFCRQIKMLFSYSSSKAIYLSMLAGQKEIVASRFDQALNGFTERLIDIDITTFLNVRLMNVAKNNVYVLNSIYLN